jgi:putative PIN family toxin of toxin-antitoxin system
MRVLLDTNILARAAGPVPGLALELVQILTQHRHELLLSPFLVTELGRVLRYPRVRRVHGFSDSEIDQFVADLILVATMVFPTPDAVTSVAHDPDDNHVLAAAVTGQVDILCTLDRHFFDPKVVSYCRNQGIALLTDRELLELLRREG